MTRPPKKPKKHRATVILFDETKRADYLTGFHKRKVERRKLALKRAADELKTEKRLLKERHEALVLERAQMLAPDLQLVECGPPVNEDLPDHTVTITELDLRGDSAATVSFTAAESAVELPHMSKKVFNKRLKDDLKLKPSKNKFQRKNKLTKKNNKKRKRKRKPNGNKRKG